MGGIWWPLFHYLHYNLQSLINYLCMLDTTLSTLIPLDWLNGTIDQYKVKCKKLILSKP